MILKRTPYLKAMPSKVPYPPRPHLDILDLFLYIIQSFPRFSHRQDIPIAALVSFVESSLIRITNAI